MSSAAETVLAPVSRRSGLRIVPGGFRLGALLAGLAVVGGLAVRLLHLDRFGITLCSFKATTGVPCMTCGGTRTLALLAGGDLAGALAMNPLVAVGFFILVPWALADLVLWTRGSALGLHLGPRVRRALLFAGPLVLLANWAYVIAAGR
jgi:hypothetical protein